MIEKSKEGQRPRAPKFSSGAIFGTGSLKISGPALIFNTCSLKIDKQRCNFIRNPRKFA